MLDGLPMRNLATFVTTWMEPEARRIIEANLHRNFIDHAEYPQTAEIEQRCIRMLANLFHAPGETTGARTQGSSEAIMLGALALKWQWRDASRGGREGRPTGPTSCSAATCTSCGRSSAATSTSSRASSRCRTTSTSIGPEDVEPHVDENTIGVAAVLGTTFTGHADDVRGINDAAAADQGGAGPRRPDARRWRQRRVRVAVPLPRLRLGLPARAGPLDQRLGPQVRHGVPGHRLADLPRAQRSARGPRLLRELPRQERRDVHAELLDRVARWCWRSTTTSSGSATRATATSWRRCSRTPGASAKRIAENGYFEVVGDRRGAAAARRLPAQPASTTTTSSTSRRSWPPSAAGWCRPTRCRPTRSTSRSCARS